MKLLILTLLATVGMIAGAAWFFSGDTQRASELAQMVVPEEELVPENAHVLGATESAQFTIVEFSDFQCPACKMVEPFVKSLVNRYPDDVRLVYRHFPLLTIHPDAFLAAQAGEAAALQGEFWPMHDLIFETQEDWSRSSDTRGHFIDLADRIGLDVEQFEQDLDSAPVRELVERDLSMAERYGMSGTPTFFLNGVRMNFEDIQSEITTALE